jgi:hypothetical protein
MASGLPRRPLPPLPAELQTLQTQKDNLILNGLAAIQAGYAPQPLIF